MKMTHIHQYDEESLDSTNDPTFISSSRPLPNVTLLEAYRDSCNDDTRPDHFEFDGHTIYSVKFYSTISHHLTQRRNQLPLTFRQMENIPKSSMVCLQRFFNLMLKHSGCAMKHVQQHGVCARLEVSLRPNGSSPIGNLIRCHGHFIDVLAHVHIALHDLIMSRKHNLSFVTIPYELVYAKVLQLINYIQSMTRFRASDRFCEIYRGDKCSNWLKAIVTVIMTYTGLSGETKIKYFTKWLHDENRYNPTNQHPLILTDLYMNISHNQSPTKHPCEIPEKCWNILRRCLHDNKFSETCILSIIGIMKMDKPLSHLRRFLLGTSLRDKLHFAMNICRNVIPILLAYLKTEDSSTTSVSTNTEINDWDEQQENAKNFIWDPANPEIYFPKDLAYSFLALNQFQDDLLIPKPKRKRKWIIGFTQDPMVLLIMKLQELSLLFDVFTPVYVKYLYQHIRLCHEREIKLPNEVAKLSQLDVNERSHTSRNILSNGEEEKHPNFHHALRCLKQNKTDRTSLFLICQGLDIPIIDSDDAPSGQILITSLCQHYFFPCHLILTSPLDNLASISLEEQNQLNAIICETFKNEIVIELTSNLDKKKHYYLFHQDCHFWIDRTIFCYLDFHFTDSSVNQVQESTNLYVILDKCFNNHGRYGDPMRINLHEKLQEICLHGPLCNHFLDNNARNNIHFCFSDTLDDLQKQKGFMLLDFLDTPLWDRSFFTMCPEVIFPCVSLVYQSNIFFIDKVNNLSYLHIYDRTSYKVITFTFQHADKLPPSKFKCNLFVKDRSRYKFIDSNKIKPFASLQYPEKCPNTPFDLSLAIKVYSFAKFPLGIRPRQANSISDSLKKLLISENVHHEHFRSTQKEDDPLDFQDYMTELGASFSDKSLSFFFCDKILTQMFNLGILSISSLVTKIQETQYTSLPHSIICPILCLKYKLWISIWEETLNNSNNSHKRSFFYCYDSRQDMVVCQVTDGHYAYLPFQSHILYIKISKTNKCGYWQQDVLNPYKHPEFQYNFASTLTSNFSYLDDPLKTKVINWFVENLKMNNIYEEDIHENNPNNRFLFHDVKIPTLVPIQLLDNQGVLLQHVLMVMYPYDQKKKNIVE